MNISGYLLYLELYSALIVLILILTLVLKKAYFSYSGKQFLIISIVVFALNIFDGITMILNGNSNYSAVFLHEVLMFIIYGLTPFFVGVLYIYIKFIIVGKVIVAREKLLYFAPTLLMCLLLLINLFVPFIYQIDSLGNYERLWFFPYSSLISYGFVFIIIVVLLLNRRKIKEKRAEILIFSIILAVAGGLIQIISVDILTIYPSITYSLIFVFILFEALGDIRDTLTNTYTRKKILEIIENNIITNNEFTLVLFDLDNLKQINDEIGHVAGDKAIKQFTQDLKAIFGSNVQLGRIGGDEFLMMARDFSTSDLSSKLEEVSGYYTFNNHKYEYLYSYGVVHRKEDDTRVLDQLINYVDGEMYNMKAEHKNYKRRSTDESKLK